MEFSNISFGQIEKEDGKLKCTELKRGLSALWDTNRSAIRDTQSLIRLGSASDYPWYEVSLEDTATGELLFFRSL
jgi:predicted kinase